MLRSSGPLIESNAIEEEERSSRLTERARAQARKKSKATRNVLHLDISSTNEIKAAEGEREQWREFKRGRERIEGGRGRKREGEGGRRRERRGEGERREGGRGRARGSPGDRAR